MCVGGVCDEVKASTQKNADALPPKKPSLIINTNKKTNTNKNILTGPLVGLEPLWAVVGAQQRLGDEAHKQHAALGAHRAQRRRVEAHERGVDEEREEEGHEAGKGQRKVVEVREHAKTQGRIAAALAIAASSGFPDWVLVDEKKMTGTLKSIPDRDEILPDINENLVVELYSK